MAELKDRETELNAMAASHLKQHHAWEQYRQRVLTLEQNCARLDGEESEGYVGQFNTAVTHRGKLGCKAACRCTATVGRIQQFQ